MSESEVLICRARRGKHVETARRGNTARGAPGRCGHAARAWARAEACWLATVQRAAAADQRICRRRSIRHPSRCQPATHGAHTRDHESSTPSPAIWTTVRSFSLTVKSPPWHMNLGMMRWKALCLKCNDLPLAPSPCRRRVTPSDGRSRHQHDGRYAPASIFTFSPVQRQRKFSAVFGTTSDRSRIVIRPARLPSMLMSKKTSGCLLSASPLSFAIVSTRAPCSL